MERNNGDKTSERIETEKTQNKNAFSSPSPLRHHPPSREDRYFICFRFNNSYAS